MVAVPNCFAFECDQMSPVLGLLGISYLIKLTLNLRVTKKTEYLRKVFTKTRKHLMAMTFKLDTERGLDKLI